MNRKQRRMIKAVERGTFKLSIDLNPSTKRMRSLASGRGRGNVGDAMSQAMINPFNAAKLKEQTKN